MIKALSKPKRKPTPKPEPKPELKIIINKELEEIRKNFNELRHKFSEKEIDEYRKVFYNIKNYKHLSI